MKLNTWFLKPSLLISFLFILSFFLHLLLLLKTPFATGWDGYYYLIQVKSFLLEGQMHSPDAALFYPLLIFFTRLFSDALFALKFLSALIAAFFIPAAYYTAKGFLPASDSQRNNRFSPAILTACFFLFSPALFYLAAHFPKNLLGFLFLFLFVGGLARFHSDYFSGSFHLKKLLLSLLIPFLCLIAAFLSHRLSAALAFVFSGLYLLFFLAKTRRLPFLGYDPLFSRPPSFKRSLPAPGPFFLYAPVCSPFLYNPAGFLQNPHTLAP